MQISLQIKTRWGYVIAFLLLLISYFLIFFIIKKLRNDANSVSHSYAIINNLEAIRSEITDAETGIRGYVITRDLSFLKPYNSGSKQVLRLYHELQSHSTANKAANQPKIDSLGLLIQNKLDHLAQILATYRQQGNIPPGDAIAIHESGKVTMEQILKLVTDLRESEESLMSVRNGNLRSFFQTMTIMTVISLVVALITVVYSLVTYNRENKAKENADANAGAYREELEDRINELNNVNVELDELKSIEKFAASGRIARTIAHEVRNPLTNISLAAEQLREAGNQTEETELLLGMISRSTTRINQLVSDLLSATRIEQLEFTPTEVNRLLDEALEQAQDRIELKHIKVVKHYDDHLSELYLDRPKVKLAFLNIIVNAAEAMQNDEGVLELRTYRERDKCVIEFKDNGSGMDAETQQKLFDPYFTSKAKGNGLGLTHTQNIIINHKGNISVRSRPGQGSTFFVVFPVNSNRPQ